MKKEEIHKLLDFFELPIHTFEATFFNFLHTVDFSIIRVNIEKHLLDFIKIEKIQENLTLPPFNSVHFNHSVRMLSLEQPDDVVSVQDVICYNDPIKAFVFNTLLILKTSP